MHLAQHNTPGVIRIKRRRNEDSLQALCIEEEGNGGSGNEASDSTANKKRKIIFRLKTVDSVKKYKEAPILKSTKEDHVFLYENLSSEEVKPVIPQEEEKELQPEINDLLQQYLIQEKKKHEEQAATCEENDFELDNNEFVYDIYFREEVSEDDDTFIFDKNTMGYIKIIEDSLVPDAETDLSDNNNMSDDQDSNEEDYYQNDYPEDEDDDRSILFGSDASETASVINETSYNRDVLVSSSGLINGEYDQLYSKMSASGNFLDSLNQKNSESDNEYGSEEDYNDYDDYAAQMDASDDFVVVNNYEDDDYEEYPRNQFFATDQDDPLAMHRDKIMYKLQKMINNKK